MKNPIIKLYFLFVLSIVTIIGCNNAPQDKADDIKSEQANVNQKNEEVKNAERELQLAKDEYNQSVIDSTNEYIIYHDETIIRINENDKKIAQMIRNLKKENKEVRAKYEMQMIELNDKNNKLKSKINSYNNKTYNNWQKFKFSFNQEMDDLGNSISEMAENK